jgi:hypothetical protein
MIAQDNPSTDLMPLPGYASILAALLRDLPPAPPEWPQYALHKALRKALQESCRELVLEEGALPDYADDAGEVTRIFEKFANDYKGVFWANFMGHAAKVFRRLFAAQGAPMLPPADVVAMHMRMSEGAVRMVYEGIRAVGKAGGVLPALAELQARSEAAEAADKENVAPRRRPMTSAAPAPAEAVAFVPRCAVVADVVSAPEAPPRRRAITIPAEPKTGFFS